MAAQAECARAMAADADRELVARQLGREPRAFHRVAVRCPFGAPAVTEQQPYTVDGEPFPTTYYLTCPHLVAAVSRLEAAGGVERWSAAAREEPELAASLARGRRRAAPHPPGARGRSGPDATAARRSSSASAARAAAAASSASTRTSHTRSRARATSSASGSSRSSSRSGPTAAAPLIDEPVASREARVGGRHAPARGRARRRPPLPPAARAPRPHPRRAPQARRADVHARASSPPRTARPRRGRASFSTTAAPSPGWPRELTTVLAAAFDAYQLGAVDYTP